MLEGDTKSAPDKLIWDHLASAEIALLVPPGHPFAKRREPVDLAELARQPLIVNEPRIGYGRSIAAKFAERDLTPEIVADCDDLESLKCMVAAGGGVALVPRLIAEREIGRGLLLAAPINPPLSVSIQLLRSQDVLPPRLERFRSQLIKEVAETMSSAARGKLTAAAGRLSSSP